MVAGLAGGLVAGLALGVPGFAGAQANNAPVAIESNASTLAKAASVTLSDSATSDSATSDSATSDTAPGAKGHGPRGGKGAPVEAAAKALGMTAEELKAELMAGKTIAQVATAKGVAISTVTDALVAEFKAHLDEEVASGEHTQAEADAKLAEFTTRVADMVNNVRPAGGPGMGKGEGPGANGHGPRGGKGAPVEAAAKALGMTAEELKAELMAGKTIAQVATAKGVAISTVTDALVAEFKAHLDEEVASGEHTQAEADAKLAEFTTRVADMVNNVRPAGAPGMGKGEGPGTNGHGPRGMGEGHGPRGGGRHGGGHDGAMSSAPTLQGEVTTSPAANA